MKEGALVNTSEMLTKASLLLLMLLLLLGFVCLYLYDGYSAPCYNTYWV